MKFRNVFPALLAAVLAASPAAANAVPVDGSRSSIPFAGERLSGGTGAAWLVAAILVAALAIVIFSDDDERPASP